MCGIWFLCDLSSRGNCAALYEEFQKTKHRGPDRSSFVEINHNLGNIYIGFHRLAIMDKSPLGDQPFIIEHDGKIIYVMCNGEIYNHHELQKKYHIQTKSQSDCEILPHLYVRLGMEGMMKELIGEYAIVVLEYEEDRIKICFGHDRFGIRPLFYHANDSNIMCASELKSLSKLYEHYTKLPSLLESGTYIEYVITKDGLTSSDIKRYYSHDYSISHLESDLDVIMKNVRVKFEHAVEMMMESDRPLGALLSGGLDSSLVVAIASRYLAKMGKQLYTFSIGIPGSTDKAYAEMVANHCGTIHTHFELTNDEFLEAIDDVILATETYDITTIRASTGQFLISKKIRETTDIRVLLIGDGSDELTGGYLYFHKAPDSYAVHLETSRLLREIHYYDVLRADRGIATHGMEARVPFLNHLFVDYYMSIPPEFKVSSKDRMEKWLLRKSFEGYLPDQVLWRKKEAFSDGVSSKEKSWYEIIQDRCNELYTDDDFKEKCKEFGHCRPPTKEALYYRDRFRELLRISCDDSSVIPAYWLPKFVGDISEPSARVLDVY